MRKVYWLSVYMHVCLSTCPSSCLYVCLSAWISSFLSSCLSACLCFFLPVCLFIFLLACLTQSLLPDTMLELDVICYCRSLVNYCNLVRKFPSRNYTEICPHLKLKQMFLYSIHHLSGYTHMWCKTPSSTIHSTLWHYLGPREIILITL